MLKGGGGGGVNVTISCSEFTSGRGNLAETAVSQGWLIVFGSVLDYVFPTLGISFRGGAPMF